MDKKIIKELIDLISHTDVMELSVEKPDLKISIKRKSDSHTYITHGQQSYRSQVPISVQQERGEQPGEHEIKGLVSIKSPIVGTFYASSSPGKDPYVSVGDNVKKGQVLCIIEAMKLMNEIESELDGKIVEVMVADSQPVEYGEVLFLIEPSLK